MTYEAVSRALEDEEAAQRARRAANGLCTRCGENAPVPEEEWCGPCVLEVETAMAELEERGA